MIYKKEPTICIYSHGRSGSNLLASIIRNDLYRDWYDEPLTMSAGWNTRNWMHMATQAFKNRQISKPEMLEVITLFSKLTEKDHDLQRAGVQLKLVLDNHEQNLAIKIFESMLKKHKLPNCVRGALFKYMVWWDKQYEKRITDFYDHIDYLIWNHRMNTLRLWASERRAEKTDIYTEWKRNGKSKVAGVKVEWDKKRYLSFYKYKLESFKIAKNDFAKFKKPKCYIKYEDYAHLGSSKKQIDFVQKSLKQCGVNITIDPFEHFLTQKQSELGDVSENFSNKQEYLDDYEEIKDKIYVA